ncbi:MAG: peptidylprolyl isomerase [Acidimicrobiia bacterium]|nr:MAG: peptidylprolyl isomerase [Acidimicrobiia bacterium]
MKRLLVLLAVFSIVAAACSGTDVVVASVNDTDILRSQVDRLVPQDDDDATSGGFAQYLSVAIQWEAVGQAAFSEFGITPTEDEITTRLDQLVADQGEGVTLEDYLASVQASEETIREVTKQLIIQDRVQEQFAASAEPIADDLVNQELVDSPMDWTIVCAAHILVETEDEATAVAARLESGEDFATVAEEVSLDPGSAANGGDLGCNSPAGFVEPFALATMEAEIDVPTAPVESEFGFHIIVVSQREEATTDVVRQTLERDTLTNAVTDWFVRVIESAEVVVDDDIGVWVTEPRPQVIAVN